MHRHAAALAAALVAACSPDVASHDARADTAPRRPVVVELFSSEGCSSCPPADAVLRRLDREQPVSGAEVIALELHVDYWNDLGWADPFSSPAFSARQRGYARALGLHGVYTPQMVVDGGAELNGSDAAGARRAIAAAEAAPKVDVALAKDGARVVVTAGAADGAEALFALTEAELATAVPRGENAGATLQHGPVVRELVRLGPTGAAPTRFVVTPNLGGVRVENARAVAFVQRARDLRIVGAASMPLR
ncbi:MAG TPA: DUF1223 domain-containing protein [Minicystis sp.]|nr:DUF1223 domain-containing protein [Minicystis sp.]